MSTILIAPGLNGSGPDHWQSWFERKLPGSVRVEQSNWQEPELPRWADAVRRELELARGQVWIIAHSFGCLASAVAAVDYRDKVAGIMFVAPADPDKFNVASLLPDQHLGFPSVVVASTNDPWLRLTKAAYWAGVWGSHLINLGAVGHINVDSGFGPWAEGLEIFEHLRRAQADLPLGSLDSEPPLKRYKLTSAAKRLRPSRAQRLAANWDAWLYGTPEQAA